MTECNQKRFGFASHFSRRVETSFTAGQVSTDDGALLLRQADRKISLLSRVAACFTDQRSPLLVEHQLAEMLPSVSTGWRWAMRTSTIMSSCATIHRWRCCRAGASWKSPWRARAR